MWRWDGLGEYKSYMYSSRETMEGQLDMVPGAPASHGLVPGAPASQGWSQILKNQNIFSKKYENKICCFFNCSETAKNEVFRILIPQPPWDEDWSDPKKTIPGFDVFECFGKYVMPTPQKR